MILMSPLLLIMIILAGYLRLDLKIPGQIQQTHSSSNTSQLKTSLDILNLTLPYFLSSKTSHYGKLE